MENKPYRKDKCCMILFTRDTQSSQNHRDRKQNDGFQGWSKEGERSYCLMGEEFQSYNVKRLRDGWWVWLHEIMKAYNASEVYTYND